MDLVTIMFIFKVFAVVVMCVVMCLRNCVDTNTKSYAVRARNLRYTTSCVVFLQW